MTQILPGPRARSNDPNPPRASGTIDKIDQLLIEIHFTADAFSQQMSTLSRVLLHENIMWNQINDYGWLSTGGKGLGVAGLAPVWELGMFEKKW